ncbi:hypothetical protein HMI56_007035 [Coelomomyces lativittatus]|nr:hypothetical protein HMI56_007035 [Coelomomyces lativittatus]
MRKTIIISNFLTLCLFFASFGLSAPEVDYTFDKENQEKIRQIHDKLRKDGQIYTYSNELQTHAHFRASSIAKSCNLTPQNVLGKFENVLSRKQPLNSGDEPLRVALEMIQGWEVQLELVEKAISNTLNFDKLSEQLEFKNLRNILTSTEVGCALSLLEPTHECAESKISAILVSSLVVVCECTLLLLLLLFFLPPSFSF